jgi:hypothetical protein
MNAHGDASCSRGKIIAKQRTLAAFIELAIFIEREGAGWNYDPGPNFS